MATQRRTRWSRAKRHLPACLLLLVLAAALTCILWSNIRLSNQERRFVGTWKNTHRVGSLLDFRPDRTLRSKTPGDSRVAYAEWRIRNSQLEITYSGRDAGREILARLTGRRQAGDSFRILSVSDQSIVLMTTSGKRTLVRCQDAELAGAP